MSGQFVWYELMTSDSASALEFYPAVTGWGTDEFDKMQYTMWTADHVPLGGVVQLTAEQIANGMPNHWLPYIGADDVDTTANTITALGGRVLFGPRDIPGTGRFAVVSDPQGATFAIYRSVDPSGGFDGTRKIGRFVWHELLTTDVDAALGFYRTVFGWEKTSAFDMGADAGVYQMFGKDGAEYGGMFKGSGRMMGMRPFWTCYVHVNDVRKAAAVAVKRGGQVVNGPMEVPGGDWIAVIMDPQGATFAVHQNPVARKAKPARPGAKQSSRSRKSAPRKKQTTKTTKKRPKKNASTSPRARVAKRRTGKRTTKTARPRRRKR